MDKVKFKKPLFGSLSKSIGEIEVHCLDPQLRGGLYDRKALGGVLAISCRMPKIKLWSGTYNRTVKQQGKNWIIMMVVLSGFWLGAYLQ